MKYIIRFLPIILMGFAILPAFSQESENMPIDSAFSTGINSPSENFTPNAGGIALGAGFQLAYPMGEFRKNNNHTGIGIGGYLGVLLKEAPVRIGFEFMTMFYGSLDSKVDYTVGDYEATTDYNFSHYDLFCRIQPAEGIIQPYIEGLVGFNYLSTTQKISDPYDSFEDDATMVYDFAFSYGLGGGVQIYLGKLFNAASIINGSLYLDADIRYLFGGNAEYVPANGVVFHGGEAYFEKRESRTDIIAARLGVGVKF